MSTTNITSNTQLLSLQHGQVSAELLEILTALAACDSGVILTSIHEGQGHAVALKKIAAHHAHTSDQWRWYILDSQKDSPTPLITPSDWNKLKGSVITIQHDSIWDHVSDGSDLHLADWTVLPHSKYSHCGLSD